MRIKVISTEKAIERLFHVTGGEHISSDDYFKSGVLLGSTSLVKELEVHKVRIQESIQRQIDKNNVTRSKGMLTEEMIGNFVVVEIKLLLK